MKEDYRLPQAADHGERDFDSAATPAVQTFRSHGVDTYMVDSTGDNCTFLRLSMHDRTITTWSRATLRPRASPNAHERLFEADATLHIVLLSTDHQELLQ